jgi:hypothetical protein
MVKSVDGADKGCSEHHLQYNILKSSLNSASEMSIEINISPKLQELIDKANHNFESAKDIVMAAYNQALTEGFSPREAKRILYERIHCLHDRTIRRYLPLEAKDVKKIRTSVVDNDPQKLEEIPDNNPNGESGKVVTFSSNKPDNIQELYEIFLQLQNKVGKMDENIVALLDEQSRIDHNKKPISDRIYVEVDIPTLYREVQLLKLNNRAYAKILIENGKYVRLEHI